MPVKIHSRSREHCTASGTAEGVASEKYGFLRSKNPVRAVPRAGRNFLELLNV
ncbi:MAG: hypothetical protein VB042_08780 [Victivallaceae bacterium]|nr:hypothetical protein [Victivallaceae bacterium]